MFDVITIGSCTADIFLKVGRQNIKGKKFYFAFGKKEPLENARVESGGGAGNVACGLAKNGFAVAVVSGVGCDLFGDLVAKDLQKFCVEAKFLQKNEKMPTAVSAIVSGVKNTDRAAMVYKGACHFMLVNNLPLLEMQTKWFYIAPLRETSMELYAVLIDFAKKNNIKVAVNPSVEQIKKYGIGLLTGVDLLFVNQEEAKMFGGVSKIKCKMQGSAGVVISDGGRGAVAFFNGREYKIKANKDVAVVEKNGVGDAFASGFLSCFLKNNSVEYCLQAGVRNAESVIQQIGAKNGLLKL